MWGAPVLRGELGEWHWDLWGHSHGGVVVTGEGAVRAGCPHGQSLPLPFPWSGAPKHHPKALPSALRTWILSVTWTLQGCPGVFSNKTTIPYRNKINTPLFTIKDLTEARGGLTAGD